MNEGRRGIESAVEGREKELNELAEAIYQLTERHSRLGTRLRHPESPEDFRAAADEVDLILEDWKVVSYKLLERAGLSWGEFLALRSQRGS